MWSEDENQAILETLGVTATAPAGDLLVIFDNAYGEFVDTEQRVPMIRCSTADAERVSITKKGAFVTVAGARYKVRRHEPDGTGMSRLILEG